MTTPEDIERPPEEQTWTLEPAPEATANRSESDISDEDRGRPLGQWVAAGGSGAALGGVGLFHFFGPVGLAAGAVTAAGGAAVYGYHRVRRNRPGFKMARTRRSTSRLGSAGKGGPKLGRGKGPKLGGGKGGKLGKGGGPKLGKGGKLGGGKSGKLLGGKSGKLGGGRSGKLLGGGRGSKLGGKLGRKTTSRLGSVGKSGGKLLGRGGKAGLGRGARGGKLLGGKGKTGVGRWGKSTGGGAGILGRGAKKLGRKTGAAALRTKAGQRAGKGFKAAKSAMHSAAPGRGRWKNMHRAARGAMGSSRNPFARWSASIAAALAVLTAMGHDKWKARKAKQQAASNATTEEAKNEPKPEGVPREPGKPREDKRTVDDFTAEELLTTPEGRLALKKKQLKDMKEAFEKLRSNGPTDPEVEAEHMANRQRIEKEIGDLRRVTGTRATVGAFEDLKNRNGGRSEVYENGVLIGHYIYKVGGGGKPDSFIPLSEGTKQRRTMTAFPLAAGAAEMNAAAAAHAPQSMLQVANELDQFGEVPTQVALAVRTYTMRLESDYPIHAAVVEKIQEFAIAEAHLKSIADEIGPLFRQVHAKDLERFESPRTNEQAWDVSSV